jgi:hypothetical protein
LECGQSKSCAPGWHWRTPPNYSVHPTTLRTGLLLRWRFFRQLTAYVPGRLWSANAICTIRRYPGVYTWVDLPGERVKRTDWFIEYSGETTEELLGYPAKGQIDCLVRAFEEGIQCKSSQRSQRLTEEERVVLAVRGLEREVNNGGYDQFFRNASRKFVPIIVQSLERIGCIRTANITQRAIKALRVSALTASRIAGVMQRKNEERDRELEECDQVFYRTPQGIAKRLHAFIKANRRHIRL